MAFTLSHAVVAPVLYTVFKKKIPLSAFAFGAVVPDMPRLFNIDANYSHTFFGLFSLNILLGLIFCLLWLWLYKPFCYALCHRAIPTWRCVSYSGWLLACIVGLTIGGLTHFVWDSFTHADFRTWAFYAGLSQPVSVWGWTMPLHRFLQYSTSAVALFFLPFLFKPLWSAPLSVCFKMRFPWLWVILGCTVSGIWFAIWRQNILSWAYHIDFYFFIGYLIVIFMQGFLLLFTILALLFRMIFSRQIQNPT